MADLTDSQAAQTVKIVGANSSGVEDNYIEVDTNGNALVKNLSVGPVTPGTVATGSSLIGGQFNTSLPILTNGQQSAFQADSSGRLLIGAIPTGANTIGAVTQASGPWSQNITQFGGTNLSTGTGSSGAGIPRITVANDSNILATQSGIWIVQPGNTQNSTPWLVTDSSDGTVGAGAAASKSSLGGLVYNSTLPTLTNSQQVALQGDSNGALLIKQVQNVATYSASAASLSVAPSATDIVSIGGSASKKVTITGVNVSGTQTTGGVVDISLIKRSTLNTGGGLGTIVQTQNALTTASSATATVTVTATTAGNLLVIGTANSDNRTVSSVSDGTTNFTQATGAATNSGGQNGRLDFWYLPSANAGKTTITVTFSGTSTTKQLYFWEISGNSTGFQLAAVQGATNIAATESGAAITSTNPGVVIGLIITSGTITASPAASNTQFTNGTISSNSKSAVEWVLGATGTYTPSWNDSGSGAAYCASSIAFTAIGNTVPSITAIPHDSNDPAATASVHNYLADPTLGTAVGTVRSVRTLMTTTTGQPGYASWQFNDSFSKGIILNNANESLNISLNGQTVAGGVLTVDIEWTEQ